ncbi:MAG: TetR/AcrR family transcriptional regulator [Gemmatimonadales bacterium]
MAETASRDQILDAAERLFAEQGFARTTIKQIGRAAGVNSALLYYYFADKEELYQEVLRRLIGHLVERTSGSLDQPGPPESRLRALVAAQAEVIAANPRFPRLLVRELAESDAAHAVGQLHVLAATTFRRLCDLVREGQAAGVFRRGLDPRFAAISIVSQVAYFTIARPAIRILLKTGPEGPSLGTLRAFARHAADFALAGLTARPLVARRGRTRKAG